MGGSERTRAEAEARYPALYQFLGCYLHEDSGMEFGSPQQAVDAAIADYPLALRQQVRRELAALLAATDEDTRLRAVLNDGLGVNVYFRKAGEARAFAEEVERKLLRSVKAGFAARRKENRG